jgi:NMD protein affecting ribosome stability and mRNA decay
MTTVGNASMVFKTVISIRLPENSPKAIVNPIGIPIIAARRVEAMLTLRDTPTMATISVSNEITSRMADKKLSISKSMK